MLFHGHDLIKFYLLIVKVAVAEICVQYFQWR
jgi:hypothetical protein